VPPDDSLLLSDVLKRLDSTLEHLLDIKSTMVTRDEYSSAKDRIYQKMADIEHETLEAVRDGLKAINKRMDDMDTAQDDRDKAVADKKKTKVQTILNIVLTAGGWIVAMLSGLASYYGIHLIHK